MLSLIPVAELAGSCIDHSGAMRGKNRNSTTVRGKAWRISSTAIRRLSSGLTRVTSWFSPTMAAVTTMAAPT
jgi:hypothetical protein